MDYLLYFTGFSIGLALFLYALSHYRDGQEKRKRDVRSPGKSAPPRMKLAPESVTCRDRISGLPPRVCPLCGSVLTQNEALFASPVEGAKGRKIMIFGCRHCYKEVKGGDVAPG